MTKFVFAKNADHARVLAQKFPDAVCKTIGEAAHRVDVFTNYLFTQLRLFRVSIRDVNDSGWFVWTDEPIPAGAVVHWDGWPDKSYIPKHRTKTNTAGFESYNQVTTHPVPLVYRRNEPKTFYQIEEVI